MRYNLYGLIIHYGVFYFFAIEQKKFFLLSLLEIKCSSSSTKLKLCKICLCVWQTATELNLAWSIVGLLHNQLHKKICSPTRRSKGRNWRCISPDLQQINADWRSTKGLPSPFWQVTRKPQIGLSSWPVTVATGQMLGCWELLDFLT